MSRIFTDAPEIGFLHPAPPKPISGTHIRIGAGNKAFDVPVTIKPSVNTRFSEPQGTREEQMSQLARATKLEKGKGLKVPGRVTGMHSSLKEEMATITVEVGKSGTSTQKFSVKVPHKMAPSLATRKVDIILAFVDEDE